LRASAYRHTGRPSEATLDVERALALAPDHPGALLERGILRRQAGDDKGARADWNAVIARHPLDPAAEAARRHLAEMAAGGSAPR
jgi:regulator of sirC expression with transglutaminase-like and TPR domain